MHPARRRRSHLFTLRLWQEGDGREEKTLRFKVQHVLSGEVRYFRDWSQVVAFIISMTKKEADDNG